MHCRRKIEENLWQCQTKICHWLFDSNYWRQIIFPGFQRISSFLNFKFWKKEAQNISLTKDCTQCSHLNAHSSLIWTASFKSKLLSLWSDNVRKYIFLSCMLKNICDFRFNIQKYWMWVLQKRTARTIIVKSKSLISGLLNKSLCLVYFARVK